MGKTLRLPTFRALAAAQVAVVVAVAAVWFYFRTRAYLAGPPDLDAYAWSWRFQCLVFAIYWLPRILFFTGMVLIVERVMLIPYYRAASRRASLQPRQEA